VGSSCLMGPEFQSGMIKKIWIVMTVIQQCELTKCHKTVHLK
jgi:hypothetical protein